MLQLHALLLTGDLSQVYKSIKIVSSAACMHM